MKRPETTYVDLVDLDDTHNRVVLTTHRPEFLDVIDYNKNIRLMHPDFCLLGVF